MAKKLLKIILALELVLIASYVIYEYRLMNQLSSQPEVKVVIPQKKVAPKPVTKPISLLFGGDVMLGRTVESNIRRNGTTWPFDRIASVTSKADLFVVNLESPFRTDAPSTEAGSLILRGYPPAVAGMVKAGVDVVSLANNHIPDMGLVGLQETKKILDKNRIGFTGAGESTKEARQVHIEEVEGMKIAFLSYTYGVNFDRTGVYYNQTVVSRVKVDVPAALKQADMVIVLVHFGPEYATSPSQSQKTFAQAAVDAGAALVIGHHPHVPQPYEKYKSGHIFYSLGNLVFDQQQIDFRDRSALVEVTIEDKKIKSFKLVPYQIFSYGQPRFLSEKLAQPILERFQLNP